MSLHKTPSHVVDNQLLFLLLVNIAVVVTGASFVGGTFTSAYNFQSMASQVPELGLLALGVTLAMISGNGGIDLSGISLANLASIVGFMLAHHFVSPNEASLLFTWVFAGVVLLVGVLGGFINGMLIAWAGLTPLIATLGTQLLFTGVSVFLTNGSSMVLGYIEALDDFGNSPFFGVPLCFAVFFMIVVLLAFVLRYTAFGMRLMLLGSNAKAARYGGINEKRMLLVTYVICGMLASVAGFIIAARNASVKWDYGSSYVLIAILIAVLGGVRPEGGYGRVVCVVLAAMALQILSSLFNFMDISNFFRDLAWGVLLLVLLALARVQFGQLLRIKR